MLSNEDVEAFIKSMDELSKATIAQIRAKENWIDDSDPDVMNHILDVDELIKKNPSAFGDVEPDLGVRLAAKFDIGRSLVFLKQLSEAQSALVYKMMSPDHLSNDESLLYQAVFMSRLTTIMKTPLVQDIFGTPARVSVVSKYLQKTIQFKIVDKEEENAE